MLTDYLAASAEYQESLCLVKKNSEGRVWLIGGFIFRNLIHELYGGSLPQFDLNFIVERSKTPLLADDAWTIKENRNGNPKLIKGTISIDFIPLDSVHSIQRRRLRPTIENYLSGVPLSVQSLAYSVDEKKLMGEVGINSILNKKIAINDYEEFLYTTERKGLKGFELLTEKATQLGFGAVLPEQ